jgi:protein SCO1/2
MTRGFIPLVALIIVAGLAALDWGTDGFRVLTSEGARRLDIERAPRPVPDVALVDQSGAGFSLRDYRGKLLLVEFIYTSCPTICGVLGDDFRRILDTLGRDHASQDVALLSISFDPAHDGPAELRLYGERFGAAAPRWRIAVPRTAAGLTALLKSFGVVVIPDQFGGFVHNAAIYLVDRRGRLVRILDAEAPASVVERVLGAVPS